jgi:outer membrane protein TolC
LASAHRHHPLGLLMAFVLVAVGAMAESPGSVAPSMHPKEATVEGAMSLTTEEAVALALNNSRQLQSLDTQVEIQDYRRHSADWIDNPEMRVRNLSTRSRNERFDELEIGVRWRPPALGEVAEERQQDQVLLWERKVKAQRARDWLASRVRRASADVIMYRELVRFAAARVDNETQRIAQIKAMVDLGRRSIVYYTKSRMMVSEAKNEYTRHLQALGEEERRLQRLTGISSAIDVIFEPLPEIDPDREKLLTIAYAHRPEVLLVEARQQLAVKQHQREQRRRLPWLSFVEVSHHREQGAEDWNELMFGVELPLFGRRGGRSQATKLSIARKEAQSLAIRERIEDEVYDTFSAYDGARLAWQLAQDDGQILIEEASRVISEASVHGTIHADEVLELERTIMDTRVIIAQRRRELAHAVCFLYYALGIEKPEQPPPPPTR